MTERPQRRPRSAVPSTIVGVVPMLACTSATSKSSAAPARAAPCGRATPSDARRPAPPATARARRAARRARRRARASAWPGSPRRCTSVRRRAVDRLGHRPLAGELRRARGDRHEDHRDVAQLRVGAHAREHVEAVHPRHEDVERHRVEVLVAQPRERVGAGVHLHASARPSGCSCWAISAASAGSSSTISTRRAASAAARAGAAAPAELAAARRRRQRDGERRARARAVLCTSIVPPCRSTSDLTIDRPRPVPGLLRSSASRGRSGRRRAARPRATCRGPVSATVIASPARRPPGAA